MDLLIYSVTLLQSNKLIATMPASLYVLPNGAKLNHGYVNGILFPLLCVSHTQYRDIVHHCDVYTSAKDDSCIDLWYNWLSFA